jgi:hypothetical protein
VPTVLGKLRCGHITSVYLGNGWASVSCLEKCPAVVPCATADGESGSSLKLGSCVDQHRVLLGIGKTCFEKCFQNEPLHITEFSANKP